MAAVNYEINNVLFPFRFAVQHFQAFSQEVEWNGRAVCHLILGILEILPIGINYIIAIFDAIFNHNAPQVLAVPPLPNPPALVVPFPPAPPAAEPKDYYLTNCRPHIVDAVTHSFPLIPDLINIVADFLLQGKPAAIGPEELTEIYGVETEQLELGPEFYTWWHSPDAHDLMLNQADPNHPVRLNCETHYPPVLRPQSITHIDTHTREVLTLKTIGRLAENTKAGYHPSRYNYRAPALTQNEQAEAGPACYVSLRREMLGKGLSLPEQIQLMQKLNADFGAGYEEEDSAADVIFVVFTIHASTGVRPLGDATGAEGRYTLSRCSRNTMRYENKTYPLVVGYFSPLVVGAPGPSGGLDVHHYYFAHDSIGVSGLRKFSGH